MDINNYQERLKAAQDKLVKLNTTKDKYIQKINKLKNTLIDHGYNLDLLDTYIWSAEPSDMYRIRCDLEYAKEDLKHKEVDIINQENIVNSYKEKLAKAINTDNIINNNIPKVFIEFLDQWKKRVYDYYINGFNDYLAKIKELRLQRPNYVPYYYGRDNTAYYAYKEWEEKYSAIQDPLFDKLALEGSNKEKYLNDLLEEEKKNKLLDLNRRVTKVVGTITDASNLYIGYDGNINGIVIGEQGKAKVTTISAEGPIQRFHYRVLVHKIS